MKKYFLVTFEYSENVCCTNIAHAETAVEVEKHYAKYEWVNVRECAEHELETARRKGMSFVEIETEKMLAKEKEGELFKQDLPVCLLKESWNKGLKQQTEIILVLMDEQEHEYKYPYPVVAVDIDEMSLDGDRTAIFKTSEAISDTFVARISTTFHGIDLEMEIAEELNIQWVESIFYEDGSIITPEMVERTTMQGKGESLW